jgi:hypothetical protein
MSTAVTREEQAEVWSWWECHIESLQKKGGVTPNGLEALRIRVADPDQIGYGQGQIRPGKLGQWDVFYELEMWGIPRAERLLLAGLSNLEVRAEEEKEELRSYGIDPDNPDEVAEHQCLKNMTPQELDTEIQRLESLLCSS